MGCGLFASLTPGCSRLGAAVLLAGAAVLGAGAPPAAADPALVADLEALGPYVAVRLAGGVRRSVLVPGTEACARVVRREAAVQWVSRGFPGRIEAGDAHCEAAGILDLERWRDGRPRPERAVPRATARWRLLHREGGWALLRGRFPLAPLVGMAGAWDLVAVVSDDEACGPVLEGEAGTLEYRAAGRPAFRLVAGEGRCPVLGFARPLP